MELYENSTYGFRMSYPGGWIKQPGFSEALVVAFLNVTDCSEPFPQLNVSVTDLKTIPIQSLDDLSEMCLQSLKQEIPGLNQSKVEHTNISGLPARGCEMSAVIPLDPDGNKSFEWRLYQRWTIKEVDKTRVSFVVTFTAKSEDFYKFKDIMVDCMKSVEFAKIKSKLESLYLRPYFDAKAGFFLLVPATWQKKETSAASQAITVHEYNLEEEKILLECRVLVQTLPKVFVENPTTYSAFCRAQIEKNEKLSKLLYNRSNTVEITKSISNQELEKYERTLYYDHEQKGFCLQSWLVPLKSVHTGKAYHVSCGYYGVDPDDERFNVVIKRTILSFSLFEPGATPDVNYVVYENLVYKFRLNFRNNLQCQENMFGSVVFVNLNGNNSFFGQSEYPSSFHIMGYKNKSMEQILEFMKKEQEMLKEIKNASQKDITFSNAKQAKEVRFEGSIAPADEGMGMGPGAFEVVSVKSLQIIAMYGDIGLIISYSAKEDNFDTDYPKVKPLLDSFAFAL